MSTPDPLSRSRFPPKMRWNEDSLLGTACFAYNKEHSKPEYWGPGGGAINRHVFAMRAALLAIGFFEERVDPTTARRVHEDNE